MARASDASASARQRDGAAAPTLTDPSRSTGVAACCAVSRLLHSPDLSPHHALFHRLFLRLRRRTAKRLEPLVGEHGHQPAAPVAVAHDLCPLSFRRLSGRAYAQSTQRLHRHPAASVPFPPSDVQPHRRVLLRGRRRDHISAGAPPHSCLCPRPDRRIHLHLFRLSPGARAGPSAARRTRVDPALHPLLVSLDRRAPSRLCRGSRGRAAPGHPLRLLLLPVLLSRRGDPPDLLRSEERRVGKECRSRWWPYS